MAESTPLVQFKNLGKRFEGNRFVLKDLDLEVKPGEFISIIGPSGCGKSTLLRMLAGLTTVSEGELLVESQPIVEPRDDLYMVFQDANLLPWARVEQNVELPLRLKGIPKSERKKVAQSMIDLVGLKDVSHKYPRQLSGGMKMRVSIARALSVNPKFLLLDEPFGALDAITRNQLNEDLLNIHERDHFTAFFVTHSVAEAVFLSTRIIVLSHNPGTIADIIEVPQPLPRGPEFRESSAYFDLLTETSIALRNAQKET